MGAAVRQDKKFRTREAKSQEKIEQLAAIAERERISRDLHDIIGHSLTSIALTADLAEQLIKADKIEQANIQIGQVASLTRATLSEVRSAVTGLKAPKLTQVFSQLAAQLKQQNYRVHIDNQLDSLYQQNNDSTLFSADIEAIFSLILTEAVTNILRHSTGDEVALTLLNHQEQLSLIVSDNGDSANNGDVNFGNGLMGIKERCQQIQADFIVEHNQGFSIQVKLAKPSIK